jgi:hypothetical protein
MFKLFFLLSSFFVFSQNFLQPIFLNNTWRFKMYHDLATSTGVVCPEESIFLMNVYPESDQNYYWMLQICNNLYCYFNFNNVPYTEEFYNFTEAGSTLAVCNIEKTLSRKVCKLKNNGV